LSIFPYLRRVQIGYKLATNKRGKSFANDPGRASQAGKKGGSLSDGNFKMPLNALQKLVEEVAKTAIVADASPE
jgi:hypothetical protein